MKGLSDFFRIIEVPLYLLVIAGYQFAYSNLVSPIIFIVFAISRLGVNYLEIRNGNKSS